MSSFDNFQCKDRQSESTGNNDSLSRQVFDQAHNFKWTGGSDQTNASSFLPPLSLDFGTGDQIQKQSGKTDVAGAADTTATADAGGTVGDTASSAANAPGGTAGDSRAAELAMVTQLEKDLQVLDQELTQLEKLLGKDPAQPPVDNTNPIPPVDNTNPIPPVDNTNPVPPVDNTNPTPPVSGRFSVQGTQIIGPDGKPFVPVGINDTAPTTHDEYTSQMPQLAAAGANTIRIMGNAQDISDPNSAFNQEVKAATDAGMVALIAYTPYANQYGGTGEIISGSDLDTATQAMATAAGMYKDNPNVWFNTINESGTNADANNPAWMAEQTAIMSAIRATGNTNPMVVDDTEWGSGAVDSNFQNTSGILANAKTLQSFGNVIASEHMYQGNGQDENAIPGIQALQAAGMPVMIGEYGGNGDSQASAFQSTIAQAQQLNVGRLVWEDGTINGQYYPDVLQTSIGDTVRADWQQARASS